MRGSFHTLSDHLHWGKEFSHQNLLQPDCANLPSPPAHGKVTYLQRTCAECLSPFSTNSNLEQHASSSGHTSFSCICGAQFSRASTLTRHINSMVGPSFSCELCDDKAFPRLDKLGDHLRRWHRLGARAFDQYKRGSSTPGSTPDPNPLPAGGTPSAQAESLGQAYPVASGFEPMSMFSGFPSISNTVLGSSLVSEMFHDESCRRGSPS